MQNGMAAQYLKEAEKIEKRWKKTGLLDGLSASDKPMTGVLENQRFMNETAVISPFKRIQIPLIRRLYPKSWSMPDVQVATDIQLPVTQPKYRNIDDDWQDGTQDA